MRTLFYRAASRYSLYNRRRKADVVKQMMATIDARSVLFVGIGAGEEDRTNLFESLVASRLASSTGTGLGAAAPHFVTHYVQSDGLALPFIANAFDLVISNAVVEHVGNEDAQRQFVDEHVRVGRSAVITTPNRLFPIEAHTGTLFVHSRKGWTDHDGYVTRLLSKAELGALLPDRADINGRWFSPTLLALIPMSTGDASALPQVSA